MYGRYRRWTREGLFDRVLERLQLQLDDLGRIDWSQFDIDGSNIRADHAAAGARKKGGLQASQTTTSSAGAAGHLIGRSIPLPGDMLPGDVSG